jgi:hypothetical protein
VELFCTPGSISKAKVHPLLEAPHPEKIERALFEADQVACAFAEIDSARRAGRPFDVLHDHCRDTTLAMADRQSTAVVHTVHSPFDHDTTPYYARHGAKGRLVCISQSQASMAPDQAGSPELLLMYGKLHAGIVCVAPRVAGSRADA